MRKANLCRTVNLVFLVIAILLLAIWLFVRIDPLDSVASLAVILSLAFKTVEAVELRKLLD